VHKVDGWLAALSIDFIKTYLAISVVFATLSKKHSCVQVWPLQFEWKELILCPLHKSFPKPMPLFTLVQESSWTRAFLDNLSRVAVTNEKAYFEWVRGLMRYYKSVTQTRSWKFQWGLSSKKLDTYEKWVQSVQSHLHSNSETKNVIARHCLLKWDKSVMCSFEAWN